MNHRHLIRLLLVPAMMVMLISHATPAAAASTVTNCSNDLDFSIRLVSGGTINFSCGTATITLSTTKTITTNTTIDGGGKITLSGGSARRLFNVNSGISLTLQNITISDGSSPNADGGAILSDGTLVITGSKFLNNSAGAAWSGGAIFTTGPLTIQNSEFANNSAGNGGALDPRETTAITSISGSSFHDNHATNTTNGWGGAMLIWNGAPVTIDTTSIHTNTARQGGAIYLTSVSTLALNAGASVTDNIAGDSGGGIYNGGSLTMTGSTVSGNFGAGQGGGAIYNIGNATLTNAAINDNNSLDGGGIYSSGVVSIYGSSLNGNQASSLGGAIFDEAGTVHMETSSLGGNSASDGGGIFSMGIADVFASSFTDNTVTGDGGGLEIDTTGSGDVENNTFTGNSAMNGGGIFNQGTLQLYYSTFHGNKASSSGGGVYTSHGGVLISLLLTGNSAQGSGGAIFTNGALTLSTSTLAGNSANGGGGILNMGTATLINSTLSGNHANLGGGLYNTNSASLTNVTLSGNSAVNLGGALFTESGQTTNLKNTILAYSPSGGNCSGAISTSKFSLSSDQTCALPAADTIKGLNPNGLDPLLTALGNYGGGTLVLMPRANSPAVDGIVGSDSAISDQRGVARPQGNGYDIGAVERKPTDSDLAPKAYLPIVKR